MSASQQSSFNNFLLADTFGPVKFQTSQRDDDDDNGISESGVDGLRRTTRDYYGNGNVNPVYSVGPEDSELSSTQSSVAELTAAQETGLRTTFREEEDLEQALKTAVVHVRGVQGDFENDTPASTASSTQRFFLSKGGKPRDFNIGNLQKNNLVSTMRGILRENDDSLSGGTNNPNMIKEPKSYPGEIKVDSLQGDYWNNPREKKTWFCLKCFIFVLVLIVFIGGMFAVIYFLKDNNPEKSTGVLIIDDKPVLTVEETCAPVNVSLRDPISITCHLNKYWSLEVVNLWMFPPSYVNKGQPIFMDMESMTMNMSWSARYDTMQGKLSISGPPALCSSTGEYRIELMNSQNSSIYNTSVLVEVISEVLKVNVSLTQSLADNDTDFKIACQTNSGCEQSFVDFFAEINKEEKYIRGVNFTCIITYNDYDGYSVSCTGIIPDYLMTQFKRITCRPRSRLLDDLEDDEIKDLEEYLELPECDIAKHCGFKCKIEGDYFLVNSGRCDIFHRCYERRVYTSYCAPGTFFDPGVCSCRHTDELRWCQDNGAVKPGTDAVQDMCTTQ